MTYALAVAALALLVAGGLTVALVRQQARHDRYTAQLLDAFRQERAQLINKITTPERAMPDGRPGPKVVQRRTPEQQREFARVGTVAPPRDPKPDGE